jgi:phosphohistidine swiveling domain-containing protein
MKEKLRKSISNIDWIKFMDRRRSCFIYHPFIEAEFTGVKKVAGFQFKRNLYKWMGDKGTQYRSAEELKRSLDHFLWIVKSDPDKVIGWKNICLKWNEEARDLINLFESKKRDMIALEDFGKYYIKFVKILLYTVTVPYFVIASIDAALKKGESEKKFKKVLDVFNPLRGFATYPKFERSMLTYFWKSISKKSKIKRIDLIDKLNPKEILAFIKNGKLPSLEDLERRKSWCVFWFDPDTKTIVYEYDKSIMQDIPALRDEVADIGKTISGAVAYPGYINGIVCRIDNAADMKKYKKGQIIVSINTSPDLMPALHTAAGIVSDEGGIMCHAAIVARELKIPCIVGTKIATQVLKDGDSIEVDAEEGIIKIIKK